MEIIKFVWSFICSIPDPIWCALISFCGVIIGNKEAKQTAIIEARAETEQLLLQFEQQKAQWDHEKEVASDKDFDEMVASVSRYISYNVLMYQAEAMESVGKLRSKATGQLAKACDQLYSAIESDSTYDASRLLSSIIEIKRVQPSDK